MRWLVGTVGEEEIDNLIEFFVAESSGKYLKFIWTLGRRTNLAASYGANRST